jgi:hypothetical protein
VSCSAADGENLPWTRAYPVRPYATVLLIVRRLLASAEQRSACNDGPLPSKSRRVDCGDIRCAIRRQLARGTRRLGRPAGSVIGVLLPPLWHQGHTSAQAPGCSRTAVENPRDSFALLGGFFPAARSAAAQAASGGPGWSVPARWRRVSWWGSAVILAPASSPPLGPENAQNLAQPAGRIEQRRR